MFYQFEKNTSKIVGILDSLELFGRYDTEKYEVKESPIPFKLLDEFSETQEKLVEAMRPVRNQLLAETDRYMLPDFPISDEKREGFKVYRQKLRDLSETISLNNPSLPEMPTI